MDNALLAGIFSSPDFLTELDEWRSALPEVLPRLDALWVLATVHPAQAAREAAESFAGFAAAPAA